MNQIILLIFLFTYSVCVFGQAPKVTKYFDWFKEKYTINNPEFAHSDSEILIVLQFNIPDGHVSPLHEKYIDSLLEKVEKEKRFADPVVTILNLETKEQTKIDYGWTPGFSFDDKKIIYSYQNVPISGKRVLAQTLEGNRIKLYDRLSKKFEIIAVPEEGFYFDPFFLDNSNVVYTVCDATNGSYGGGVAFNRFNLLNQKTETLYAKQKSHGLYNIVGDIYPINNQIYFTLYIPQDSSAYRINDDYSHLLMNTDGIAHDFGIGTFRSVEGKLGINKDGALIYLDDDHELLADKNILVKYSGGKIIEQKELTFDYNDVSMSPDGKYLLFYNYEDGIYLIDTDTFSKTILELPDTRVFSVKWSINSDKFAIVQEHDMLEDTDLISLFKVK